MLPSHTLVLSEAEYQELLLVLEGCDAEFEELMHQKEWFTTELQDGIKRCIEIIHTCEVPF